MPIIVALTKSPPVADDGVVMANRTAPWQKFQRDYPGSALSFASGSAMNRITAGLIKGPPLTVPCRAFALRQSQFRTKKEYCFALLTASPSLTTLAGIKGLRDDGDHLYEMRVKRPSGLFIRVTDDSVRRKRPIDHR